MGPSRIMTVLQVTLYLEEQAAMLLLCGEIGITATINLLIYLTVFQVTPRSNQ